MEDFSASPVHKLELVEVSTDDTVKRAKVYRNARVESLIPLITSRRIFIVTTVYSPDFNLSLRLTSSLLNFLNQFPTVRLLKKSIFFTSFISLAVAFVLTAFIQRKCKLTWVACFSSSIIANYNTYTREWNRPYKFEYQIWNMFCQMSTGEKNWIMQRVFK